MPPIDQPPTTTQVRYHSTTCARCGVELGARYWMQPQGPMHEACVDWAARQCPYGRQSDVMRRLARHADRGRERDVLAAAAEHARVVAGWPDQALLRLKRCRELADYVRKLTRAAPDKLKASL